MKRRSLLIVVALLCMASLMAAMAYSSATVTNAAEMRVTKTEGSLLRFDAATNGNQRAPETGYTVKFEDGEMILDFTQGSSSAPGFQPNSEYVYEKLFRVVNAEQNRGNGRTSTISITATTDLPHLYLYDTKGTALIEDGISTGNVGVEGAYTIKFVIPSGTNLTKWQSVEGSKLVFTSVTSN